MLPQPKEGNPTPTWKQYWVRDAERRPWHLDVQACVQQCVCFGLLCVLEGGHMLDVQVQNCKVLYSRCEQILQDGYIKDLVLRLDSNKS